jgi:hypothetical protein
MDGKGDSLPGGKDLTANASDMAAGLTAFLSPVVEEYEKARFFTTG